MLRVPPRRWQLTAARRLGLVFAFATALATSAAATPPGPAGSGPAGSIKSVRRDLVYVDLGRAQGVQPGDVLAIEGSAARLEVVHLGEKQLAARRVGAGDVRVGAVVISPRAPGEGITRRPVVTLPPPIAPPATLPWSGDPGRRASLVPGPSLVVAPPPRVTGDVRLVYSGMIDQGEDHLDLHQAELRTRLAADLGDGFSYRHDLAARVELGPALDERSGADSRPYYKVRELALGWRSPAWGTDFADSPAGALDLALGRMHPWQIPSVGLLDGARLSLALGRGFGLGVDGGLAPRLDDTAPSTDRPVVSGHAAWLYTSDDWRAHASLTELTSFWRGALDRLDLGLSGSLARGRDFDVYGLAVATLVDGTLLADQPGLTLSRGFFGTRVRPLDWLTIDAHYAHDQGVADRETLELLGADRLVTDAREAAWLQVRFDPDAALSIALGGTFGFGSDAAEQVGGATRITWRDLGPLRLDLGYAFARTAVTVTHHPSLDVALPLGTFAEIDVGYSFATFQSRLLDERQDEHRLDLAFDLFAAGPWRVDLRTSYAFGTEPGQLAFSSLLAWRFP